MVSTSDCDKEPIHIPGSIQPHGLLFVVSEKTRIIEQVSLNISDILGVSAERVLGSSFESLFKLSPPAADLISLKNLEFTNTETKQNVQLECMGHRNDDCLIIEMELLDKDALNLHEVMVEVGAATKEMQETNDLLELCQLATDVVQRLTGHDRVMLYRFDQEWNGNVIAETLSSENVDTYMNHWFPSSDIPAQAREMLTENWIRSIPNVDYQASPIVPLINPRTKRPLNLGKSIFRSPSGIHLEYLKNMGVGATSTITILKKNKLWGLIACHHISAKPIKNIERIACQFVGQILSSLISSKEVLEDYEKSHASKAVLEQLSVHMQTSQNFMDGQTNTRPNLLDLISAGGVAASVFNEGEWTVVGNTPSKKEIKKLAKWISSNQSADEIFYTNRLPLIYPDAFSFKDYASGILAISLPKDKESFIIWFRPEVTKTVTWAGDPKKSIEMSQGKLTLHPRKSFEAWKEDLKSHAEVWKEYEVEAARKLRKLLLEIDLKRQFERFHNLTNSIDQIICTASEEGIITYFNKRWYEITGLSEDVRGEEAWLKVLHPGDVEHVFKQWKDALINAEPFYTELRIKDSNGDYRWFLIKAVPVKDNDKILKWIGSGTEIQLLKKTQVALENAIKGRDEFISVASHELKTPVTSIKLSTQLFERSNKAVLDEKAQKNLQRISKEVRNLETIIEEFLDVTKIRSGQVEYNFEKVDITKLVIEILERFEEQDRIRASYLKLKNEDPIEVFCDSFRIGQVVTNLISNAIKYGGEGPIEISIRKNTKTLNLEVKDYGMGIANEHIPLLFNRFERVADHHGIAGLGLGLYICKQIVDAHNGRILVESKLNEGSTFTLELSLSENIVNKK